VFPLSITDAGLRLHVGGLLAAVGLIEQLRFTVPENSFVPTTLMVDEFPVVAPGFTVIGASLPLLPLGPKIVSAFTVIETVVVALRLPDVPVTVTVVGPRTAAELLAASVNTWVPAAGPAVKVAVTPLGNSVAVSATVPLNPIMLSCVIVLVPLPFCATDTLVGEADNVKLGGTVTVTEAVPVALL
jgi:hypothetical protein